MTELLDDSRRAQIPADAEFSDTSPIGFALDLSSKDKVLKPIPSDEMDESQTPLPALMVLNNEGVLASWWIVYSDAVRQGTIYPNLAVAAGASQHAQPSSPPTAKLTPSAFGGAFQPTFGTTPSLGSTTVGAFGTASNIGLKQSPWGAPTTAASAAAPSSGQPTFGTATAPSTFGTTSFGKPHAPAFGSAGFSGNKSSPWGTPNTSTPAFGQATNFGKTASTFGSPAPSAGTGIPSSGGFGKFASHNGFAGAGATSTGSIFGAKQTPGVSGDSDSNSSTAATPFGGTGTFGNIGKTAFAGTETKLGLNQAGAFGSATNDFVLGSTFKPDGTAKNDDPASGNKSSPFGNIFGRALGKVGSAPPPETPISKDADMDTNDDGIRPDEPAEPVKPSSTTPASTPVPYNTSVFPSSTSTSLLGNTGSRTLASTKPVTSTGFNFGTATTTAENKSNFSFAKLGVDENKPSVPATQSAPLSRTPPSPIVKKEPSPETETGSLAGGVSEAPLPPDATSKSSYTAGDTSVSSTGTDAPLPPEFVPKPTVKPAQVSRPPPSPPAKSIHAGLIPPSDVPGGLEDEGNSSDFVTEEEGGEDSAEASEGSDEEEGSGEDVAQDISPTSEVHQIPAFTPPGSFGGQTRGTDNTLFTKLEKPSLPPLPTQQPMQQPTQPRGLFGEIDRLAPILPPPKLPLSPRSPSPIRNGVPRRLQRPETLRSSSAPGTTSRILEAQKQTLQPQNTFDLSLEQQKADEDRKAKARARKEAEETQAIVDNYDNQLLKIISSDLEGTRTLDEFVAHVEVTGPTFVESIPAQVEAVYRDINSMIDTLGLNSRALNCFIKGHTEQYKDGGRGKEDLEDEEDWCLIEIEDLSSVIEKDLTRELEDDRLKDVATKLETCNYLQKDLIRLHARHDDIKRMVASKTDPGHIASTRAQPLSAEQAAQQHDLRKDFTRFQQLLAEAEEGLAILKAKIVSQASVSGKFTGSARPTVDAVIRTITKMTSMAEKRSGDIDVLEGQMRKLRLNSATTGGSREGSPVATPNNKASLRNVGTFSTDGLFYTPESSKDDCRGFQKSLLSSTSSFAHRSSPRKKMSGYSAEEKSQLKTRLAQKREQANRLKGALQKAGTKIRLMDHDE